MQNDLIDFVQVCNTLGPSITVGPVSWFCRSLSRKFKLGRLTANRTVHKVAHALFRRASQFIKWPTPYSERLKVMKEFETLSGFPHIIGVIDDIHIRIPKPFRNSEHYLNGKRKHSMHLQVRYYFFKRRRY